MKKKYLTVIFACIFLLTAGVIYCCLYNNNEDRQEVLVTSLESGNENDSQESKNGLLEENDTVSDENNSGSNNIRTDENSELIYVHICGAVANPGVYQIKAGTRLVELIELAGGLNNEAAGDYVNQAMVVEDGQRIYIPTRDELKSLSVSEYIKGDSGSRPSDSDNGEKININTADESALMTLPGIGQAKARRIIEYREKHGNFSDVRDLMNVPGIKEGLFNQIEDKITVGN